MTAPHVITLGTAGGPRWWNRPGASNARSGISTAIVVGDDVYLVDAGQGAGRRLAEAGIALDRVRALFLTHLHGDHVADLAPLLLFAPFERRERESGPITVLGPGDRGVLPWTSVHATGGPEPEPVSPCAPTPGTVAMMDRLVEAFATDINDRILDSLARAPVELFAVSDIQLPPGTRYDPDDDPPPIAPFDVYRDENVVVTATLVEHPPMAPAFGFRFDTPGGSVTISGDTAPCANLVRLACGTDLLLHEAIDLDSIVGRDYRSEAMREATMEHHRRAHTTARQAGEMATEAGAARLALHHLVPGNAPLEAWAAASDAFRRPVLVPDDLDVLELADATQRTWP